MTENFSAKKARLQTGFTGFEISEVYFDLAL
jgi:hypothetical protein